MRNTLIILLFSLLNVGCVATPFQKEYYTQIDDRFQFGLVCGIINSQEDIDNFIKTGECPPEEITKQVKGANISLTEEEWLYLESFPLYTN